MNEFELLRADERETWRDHEDLRDEHNPDAREQRLLALGRDTDFSFAGSVSGVGRGINPGPTNVASGVAGVGRPHNRRPDFSPEVQTNRPAAPPLGPSSDAGRGQPDTKESEAA